MKRVVEVNGSSVRRMVIGLTSLMAGVGGSGSGSGFDLPKTDTEKSIENDRTAERAAALDPARVERARARAERRRARWAKSGLAEVSR